MPSLDHFLLIRIESLGPHSGERITHGVHTRRQVSGAPQNLSTTETLFSGRKKKLAIGFLS